MERKIVILTGAGMSADSGLKTFRDEDGLWEGHDVMEVASPQGFARNPNLVLEFYNQRRRQLLSAHPNEGHKALALLEKHYDVTIVTQNIDDLHERAGSSRVIHLHGELFKVRSTGNPELIMDWKTDLIMGSTCPEGHQLRPHIVWFGEEVPLLPVAANITQTADILLIIGTSLQVYPAASLIHYANPGIPIYLVDPRPTLGSGDLPNLNVITQTAASGVPALVADLIGAAI
ncbi:SIR2 family NAD-dependent protein deacylase [Lentiprolixibacter aurantiacus]|uniref:NAD-dependent protein deacylase n=1 Tax=Lentiprolixibacter aurantiacus TaxID=2993939 RepID=A0AAE3SP42_9FLAO|nr:NAD-dependent deacylase [Lentiprolixibacter aurantiacus]MCX2720210.1 NAD-dependent deacylase [Lentiprolixibacter aurantiacus]